VGLFSSPRLDNDFCFSALILDSGLDCSFQLAEFGFGFLS
jgi:hypothetical protein